MPETILLVDDDPHVLMVLASLLLEEGFDVVTARSGHEAVALLGRQPVISLVLTDVHMPDGDGRLVARAVRALRGDLPVYFLTADSAPEIGRWAAADGADGVLVKPRRPEELEPFVAGFLRRRPRGVRGPVSGGRRWSRCGVSGVGRRPEP